MAQPPPRSAQLFCWLFVVIGLGIVSWGAWTLIKSVRTTDWPVTDGVVQSAEIKRHSGDSNHGDTYSAEVTYTYQVAGASYTGNKISIGQMSSSSGYAQGILNRYPIGKKVPVHYAPADPEQAVLETGIHGGTWICFVVGTVFALFGVMFLQMMRAATKAQMSGALESSSVTVSPDGRVTTNKPPLLMGVIFLIAGVAVCFAPPSGGTPQWVVYAAGGMFGLIGVYILLARLQNKLFSKIPTLLAVLLFLAIFHWISFGAGERIGTSTTSFSQHSGTNVRIPFAIVTILMDMVIVAALIHRLRKRKND